MFNNKFKNINLSFILLTIVLVFGLFFAVQIIWAAWQVPPSPGDPGCPIGSQQPADCNIPEPINRGDGLQDKTGELVLRGLLNNEALIIKPGRELKFGDEERSLSGKGVSFKAPSPTPASDIIWTLPNIRGNAGQALTIDEVDGDDATLKWDNPASSTSDMDWTIVGDPIITDIYSTVLTRIGSGGTRDLADGAGDLYVQNDLEVDGSMRINGNILPNTTNTYNLGSSALKWANIFATNIFADNIKLGGFDQGSVIFQGITYLEEDNANFTWEDIDNRLDIANLKLPNTLSNETEGIIYFGVDSSSNSESFIHNAGAIAIGLDMVNTNTYVGKLAGSFPTIFSEDSTYYNTAVGYNSLSNNNSNSNSAFGVMSLQNNNSGMFNSAFGDRSLFSNTDGYNNSAFGTLTLYQNTLGINNSAFGYKSLNKNNSDSNSAFGHESLLDNVAGNGNSAFGYFAGHSNTTGVENTFIGYQAGVGNVNGINNVALGSDAGHSNTAGGGNVFLGNKAGYFETDSDRLYINNNNGTAAESLIYGEFWNPNPGPYEQLDPFVRINGYIGLSEMNNTVPNFNEVGFRAPAGLTASYIWALPDEQGSSNQVFVNNGDGTLRWDNLSDNDWKLVDTGAFYDLVMYTAVPDWGPYHETDLIQGRIGIGTKDPDGIFHVKGSAPSGAKPEGRNIRLEAEDSSLTNGGFAGGSIILNPGANGSGTFNPGDPQAGVGINIDQPKYTLHVEGSTRSSDYFGNDGVDYQGITDGVCILNTSGTDYKLFFVDGLFVCFGEPTTTCDNWTREQCCTAQGGCP
ncbi:MAG: hypothetical protein ABIG10_01210 [bacterium]